MVRLADRQGGLWFNSDKRIQHVLNGNVKTYDISGSSTGETYKTAYEDRHGGVWAGFYGENKQSLLRIKNGKVRSFQLPSSPVCHFAEDLEGNLWVTVYNKGIYRIDHKSVIADEPRADILEPISALEGISNVTSGYLCPDREGGVWVGTNRGLVRFLPQVIRVYSKQEGLPEDNVYPVYEDSAGRIWAGVWQNSLLRYESGSFKTFLRTNETDYITSLFEDRSGRFWVGDIGGLRYLDKRKTVDFTLQAGFSGDAEFSVIAEDRENNLWFGTDRGLSRYSGNRATVFTKEDGLPDEYIVAFLQASDGRVWIGTRGGLALMESGKIKAFTRAAIGTNPHSSGPARHSAARAAQRLHAAGCCGRPPTRGFSGEAARKPRSTVNESGHRGGPEHRSRTPLF